MSDDTYNWTQMQSSIDTNRFLIVKSDVINLKFIGHIKSDCWLSRDYPMIEIVLLNGHRIGIPFNKNEHDLRDEVLNDMRRFIINYENMNFFQLNEVEHGQKNEKGNQEDSQS